MLVVGAGPIGAILALELARHGVTSILIDRSNSASRHPKMDFINGRSAELLRRLDLIDEIRARGVAPQHPFNFIWSRDFDEPPIAVWNYSSVTELQQRIAASNDGSMPLEAHQRLQGSLLEEVLRHRVREHHRIDVREGCAFEDLEQGLHGVTARVIETATGVEHTIQARYLVGCDGAQSTVRHRLGISAQQMGPTTQHRDVYFRSTDPVLRRHGRAFLTIAAGGLTLVSRDEEDTWTGTVHLADAQARSEDPVALMRKNLGVHFRIDEVLDITEWDGRLGVTDTYHAGSAFLAGDSAHQFYPTGGHGANTGIADAVDLGWKLAACLQGWGGAALLDSYETERRPVALFNREMCANLLEVWLRFPRLVGNGASREHIAGFLEQETYQIDNLGIHFGYRYSSSPIICHESGPAPKWEWRRITPTTWPGGRAPATRLEDGTPIFDRFGTAFTLVDLSGTNVGKDMAQEANSYGVPTTYVAVDDEAMRTCWERNLVLVRPDQHVAWRGNEVPNDWHATLDRVRGN